MPAIKVYKAHGQMVPVDDAKVAKAFICPWTKEIYSSKRSYVSHLKRLRTERMHKRAKDLRFQRKLEDLWDQPDFNSIVKWINLNSDVFWENAKRQGWASDASRWDKIRDKFEIKIVHLSLDYSDCISNSHNCPRNGVTNWGGTTKLKDGTPAPRGYPGFRGNIKIQLPVEPLSFASNVLRGTGIHTGSGGAGGSGHYGYDVKFFLDDWPGLAKSVKTAIEAHEKQQTFNAVSGKSSYPFSMGFNYGKDKR